MREDRLINIRFLFCVFVSLMLGIIVSRLFLFKKISLMVFVLFLVLSFCIPCVCWWYASKTNEHNQKFRSRENLSFILKCSGIGIAVAFVIGIVVSITPLNNIIGLKDYNSEVIVTGVVSDYVDSEITYKKFIVNNPTIINNENREALSTKIIAYTTYDSSINLGDYVTFVCLLEKFDFDDEYEFTQICNDITYSTYVASNNMVVSNEQMSLRDNFKNNVRQLLESNMSQDNASICYAMLFGDKHGLSDEISDAFSYAGISHILAVSGLHIGVLVSLIWLVLNRIRLNKYVKIIFFAMILLFYVYICNFSPSVCRAGIMAFVVALCKLMKIEYDALSSLSIAGIIILLFSPMSLFTLSFQLSFMCIFAIISLAPSITYLFGKIKFPRWLAESLGVSIAINVAIIPVCMSAFAKVSLLGIIANLFVLPLFSITYILLFAITLLGLIFNLFGVLLCVPNIFLHLIKIIAYYIGLIPFGVFKVFNNGYLLLFFVCLISLTIHFLLAKHWIKSVGIGVLSIALITLFVVYSLPIKYDNGSLIIAEQYNSNVVMYNDSGENILIGSDIEYNNLLLLMKDIKLKKIDKINIKE